MHALDPPIIHRDIKPENILLDSESRVKLGDFGWSNFFNENSQRQTYCGTPEYLAPEMIKQKGHDKHLDIWNLGILFFELLAGRPPFEGKNQQQLFENILHFKIRWPKGFNGVAKDLVQKLLKTTPEERIPLEDITSHPWFKSNPPIRTVMTHEALQGQKLTKTGDLKPDEYKLITQPSLQDKNAGEEDKIAKKVQSKEIQLLKKPRESTTEELNRKLNEAYDEIKDLKQQVSMSRKEGDTLKARNKELATQAESTKASDLN